MNFMRPSPPGRITLVTCPCTHPVPPLPGKCNDGGGEKVPRWEEFAWSGVVAVSRREPGPRDRLPIQSLHVPPYQQKGVFHRPGLQFAGVKCELVTEVRPLP